MFEQSFVEGRARTRRGWSVLTSIILQTGAVAIALLIPLMKPELLPQVVTVMPLSPPPPAPPQPPDVPKMERVRPAAPSQVRGTTLVSYRNIPDQAQTIIDPPQAAGPGGGVPNSIGPGFPDERGVPNSIWSTGPQAQAPAPPPPPVQAAPPQKPTIIRVSGEVQEALLLNRVIPEYPPIAKQTRTEGTVVLTALISREGRIEDLKVISGHPLLVNAALTAVRQWRYRPTLLGAEPVEVLTTIAVHFKLTR